jgi:succinyl-diaminopimelate desuccinylase
MSTGGGTSDGRFFAPLGAEIIELGVCNQTIHMVNEYCRVEDIDLLHRTYMAVLRRVFAAG